MGADGLAREDGNEEGLVDTTIVTGVYTHIAATISESSSDLRANMLCIKNGNAADVTGRYEIPVRTMLAENKGGVSVLSGSVLEHI